MSYDIRILNFLWYAWQSSIVSPLRCEMEQSRTASYDVATRIRCPQSIVVQLSVLARLKGSLSLLSSRPLKVATVRFGRISDLLDVGLMQLRQPLLVSFFQAGSIHTPIPYSPTPVRLLLFQSTLIGTCRQLGFVGSCCIPICYGQHGVGADHLLYGGAGLGAVKAGAAICGAHRIRRRGGNAG